MADIIFLKNQHGDLIEMTERPYDAESVLQELVADHARLLSAGQTAADGSPLRWLLVTREMPVPDGVGDRWALDHLFVDQQGVPTLVEVKRATDTRSRREVVAQMLDYAANGSRYWRQLRDQFESACVAAGDVPDDRLRAVLGEAVDSEALWRIVQQNLQQGRLRLIFVADDIPIELQAIVEFLDGQMDRCDVYAVSVKQYISADGAVQTLVPRVVGRTAAAIQRKGDAPPRMWDEASFLAELDARAGRPDGAVMRHLLAALGQRPFEVVWGGGPRVGTLKVYLTMPGVARVKLMEVWTNNFHASFGIYPKVVVDAVPGMETSAAERFIDALAAIPGAKVERPKAYASGTAIYLHVLQSPDAFGRFVAALDDLLRSLNAQ